MKGRTCPICGEQKFHNKGGIHRCSYCDFIGWSWYESVEGMGTRKGIKCPVCSYQTLHRLEYIDEKRCVLRCSTCDYAGIECYD